MAAAAPKARTGSRDTDSRFRGWRPWPARLVLALVSALALYGAALDFTTGGRPLIKTEAVAEGSESDTDLYRAIAGRVAGGEGYYEAAAAEHRQRGYPLRPFVTVRLPVVAYINAWLGETGAFVVLDGLVLAAMVALARRFMADLPGHAHWPITMGIIGLIPSLLAPVASVWHEPWAAALIVLSLTLRRPGRYGASILLGLAAVSTRELALPYLAVMAAVAWWEGRAREAAAWSGAILLALAFVALHAAEVAAVTLPGDRASQGWASVGGWPFMVAAMHTVTNLVFLPLPVGGIVVPLCLLGWAASATPFGSRTACLTFGYVAGFTMFGRPDNWYWGLLIAPLFLAGLAFVPAALRDLWQAARATDPQRSTLRRMPS